MRAIFEVSAKVLAMLAFGCWSAPALAFPTDPEEWLVSPPIHTAPCDRALAAEWLGKMKAAPAYERLIALCDDADGGVRYSAVTALGQLGDPRATATLARLAADPQQEKVDGARTFTWREYFSLPGNWRLRESPGWQPTANYFAGAAVFCRAFFKKLRTVSLGWAPLEIQYSARGRSMLTLSPGFFGS
jgi:hypothetical protein